MKQKIYKSILLMAFIAVFIAQCTHDDQEIVPDIPPPSSDTELTSLFTTAPPTIDGVIDSEWDVAEEITVIATVPDPGNDVFKGYVGKSYSVILKSLYDANNIYFLAQWDDRNLDLNRQTWYFDPADSRWKQESRNPTFNSSGAMIRRPFYEDKFAFLFNVNNSVAGWDQSTCWSSCHTGMSAADGYARHYTNAGESIDMWHWKGVRTDVNFQADDQYQDDAQPNGRHGDSKDSGGYTNNTQDLTITGTSEVVSVPKYFIPNKTYYYFITQAEIDAGTAKEITAVDQNGVLTHEGGTIDPNTDLEFQRDGSTSGAKGMPSIYTTTFVGNRGDISAKGSYTGSGWVLEIKRALSTADSENQDIDFGDLSDQAFGIGVFDNAGIAHAIKPGLLLKFKK